MQTIFKNIKKIARQEGEKGITLVIAITVMTLLLSVSFSISNIVLRQIRITNINNASKPAFFVADSAAECAFYYDTAVIPDADGKNINADFATAIFGTSIDSAAMIDKVKCGNGAIVNVAKNTLNPDIVITSFDIDYGTMCAKVEVTRTEVDTKISSRGYNTDAGPDGCNLEDISTRRLVERGLTIRY